MYKIYYTNWHGVTNYAQKAIKALWRKLNYDPRTRKWLMRINLTCIFLMLLFVQVALASKAQTLSMNKKNASLIDVLKEIRVKTGYDFILPKDLAKSGNRVTIQVKNAEINIILDLCFDSQPFTYQISNKMIIVSEKEKSFVERIIDRYLSIEVRGIITDDNGRALPGATIKAKISGIQTNSDEDGRFLLEHVEERDSLIISFLGYRTVVVSVLNNVGTIKLSLNVESLLEVEVNTGYQRLLKERAPGAYVQVNQETLSKRPAANLSTALFGLVAGMQGKENADGSVNFLIRGNGSLYADRNPLVVIDGMPASTSDFSNLNPNDVENVTVLKDAAAASIWGARAANGVIVVTTKKAKAGASLHVEGTAFTRVSKHADLNQMLTAANSADHVGYEKMGFQKGWFFLPYTGSFPGDIGKPLTLAQELLYANKAGQLSSSEMNRKLDSLSQINNKTQLQDYLLRRAMLTQYNVNISSSNELSSSYGSLLFEDNKTRFQETGHRRYGINFKNEYKVAKFLRFNFGLYLQYRDQENTGATVQELAQLSPYETLIKPDGSYSTNLNVFNRTVLGMLPLSKFPYADLSYNLLREVRGRAFETKDYSARIQTGLNIKL
ncbi:MAG: TonB-dependent receptor plug domain-containing protein, partial [Bacteroidota bacterium]